MIKQVLVAALLISLASLLVSGAIADEKVGAIVVFVDRPTPEDISLLEKQGGVVRYTYDIIPGVALDIPMQALDRLREMCSNPRNPADQPICTRISYIELDQQVYMLAKPVPVQPPQTLPWGIDRVDAELSWGISTGSGIKVAVVDTGIDYTHPDLDANVKGGVTFVVGTKTYMDDNGHGTHVSGIVAAENNAIGVVGVAPDTYLYGVKVLNRQGTGWVSDVIAGIDWSVANGMQVITMSLGTSSDVQSLHDAVNSAYSQSIVLVAAAGNSGTASISYPAKYDTVIAVTATDSSDALAPFSSYGPEAELAAPGVSIYSTYKGGTYATLSGTSMAAPHVTGTVASLLATPIPPAYDLNGNNMWDPVEVRNKLHDKAIDLGPSGLDEYFGYGLVNTYNALS